MNRLVRGTLAVGFGFGVTTGAIAVRDSVLATDHRGEKLGTLDVAAFCRKRHGAAAIAIDIRNDAIGWRCQTKTNGIIASADVDYDKACSAMFGPPAHAQSSDIKWAYSWLCYRGAG